MSVNSIRGQEVALRVIVDGVPLTKSFERVVGFDMTPRIDNLDVEFVGETSDETDQQFHGWDFTFTVQDEDSGLFALIDLIIARSELSLPPPTVDIVAIFKYRTPGRPSVTRVLERAVIKLDSHGAQGRKAYINAPWSGKCRSARTV